MTGATMFAVFATRDGTISHPATNALVLQERKILSSRWRAGDWKACKWTDRQRKRAGCFRSRE